MSQRTKLALSVFLLCSLSWGQCDKADPYIHNCQNSPLWSTHGLGTDVLRLMTQPVGQKSKEEIPFYMITFPSNTVPFQLDSFEVDKEDLKHGSMSLDSDCLTPQIPPGIGHNNLNCKMLIEWTPKHEGLTTFRIYFKAHSLKDGSDFTHTVLAIGIGTKN